jgi:hypothetical protein
VVQSSGNPEEQARETSKDRNHDNPVDYTKNGAQGCHANHSKAAIEEVIRIDEDDALWEKYVTAPIFRDGKLPYELSDEAIAGFFGRVFTGHRRPVSRMKKTAQKTNRLIRRSRAYARADSIRRGGERRVKALIARLGLNG